MYKLCSIDMEECRLLHLEINQRGDGRAASLHAVQLRICRSLLSTFASAGILVAPRSDVKGVIVVAGGDVALPSSSTFKNWLLEHSVKVEAVGRVDSRSVVECLQYTLPVFLESQQYYRIGNALIKGPFLGTSTHSYTIIEFAAYCNSAGELFLRVSSEIVSLTPLQHWRPPDWAKTHRVLCLPRLGRGRLLATYRSMPPHSAFSNYAEMRAYWKNCHGYDLPVTEPDCYYDVCFSGIEDTVFLYPSFCVLCAAVRAIRFDDQNTALPALDEFLRVFSSEKFIICGGTARLDPTDRAIGLCSTSHFRSLAHAKEPYAQTFRTQAKDHKLAEVEQQFSTAGACQRDFGVRYVKRKSNSGTECVKEKTTSFSPGLELRSATSSFSPTQTATYNEANKRGKHEV